MDLKILALLALVSVVQLLKVDATKSLLIDFSNIDITDPPTTGVNISIPLRYVSEVKGFCIRFYLATLQNQRIFQTVNFDVALSFFFNDEVGWIGINRIWFIFPIPRLLTPYVYEHLCFSHNMTHYKVLVEGEVWYEELIIEENIPKLKKPFEDKDFVVGPNLGTYKMQYFNGKITEINVYSNSFTIEELTTITTTCEKVSIGNKMSDWSDVKETDLTIPEGAIVETEMRKTERMCSSRLKNLITLMPFPTSMNEANIACQAFGAQMLQPFASSDYIYILGLEDQRIRQNEVLSKIYVDTCQSRNWVPVYKSENFDKTLTILDFNNQSKVLTTNINDLPPAEWEVEYDGSKLQRCYLVDYEDRILLDKNCVKVESCIACLWESRPILRIRGLCPKASIEDHYVFVTLYYVNGMIGK